MQSTKTITMILRFPVKVILIAITLCTISVMGAPVFDDPKPFYGKDIYNDLAQGQLHNADLKSRLNFILKTTHIKHEGDFDELAQDCPQQAYCTKPHQYNYNEIRQILFGRLYLEINPQGKYQLRTIYCEKVLDDSQFRTGRGPGPDQIPDSRLVNVEHAWPQSKFNNNEPKMTQKTDLHILFPVSPDVNSLRGNHPYGEVTNHFTSPCNEVKLGFNEKDPGQPYFQPPENERGSLARALFYFSVRYHAEINPVEEEFLRKWNQEHPVDEDEKSRNDKVYQYQQTRNPFVDHPEWIDMINDF